ncbi:MAG TPA: ABC transporter substrate-binding protein [Myxococcaceae bacterium]|nr:ABC transporter substrate-binding protein [Myxococcaceae bacterium]
MAARGWMIFAVGAVSLLAFSRCSLLVGGFNECQRDSDCAGGRICVGAGPDAGERFCVVQTVPPGCLGVPDAGIAATYGPSDAGNAIHLGAAYSFTSGPGTPISPSRVQHLNAVLLALDEINQRSVGGRPVVLHVCDSQNDNELIKTQVAWMEQQNAPAVLVTGSQPVLAAATATVPRGMLLFSPTATAREITSFPATSDGGTRLVWRDSPSDVIQSKVIADLVLGQADYDAGFAPVQKVGILYSNEPYGQGLSAQLFTLLTGKKTLQSFSYARGGPDYSAAINQLSAFGPELTILVGFADDAARIVLAAQNAANLRAPGHKWFFTDAAKDPLLPTTAPAGSVEGAYGTAAGVGVGANYALFTDRFRTRFGVEPDRYTFMANNYDAMYLLAYGMSYATGAGGALTGERIAQGLTRLNVGTDIPVGPSSFTQANSALSAGGSINVAGTSGDLTFDPQTGECPSPIQVWQIQGQTIVNQAVLDPKP